MKSCFRGIYGVIAVLLFSSTAAAQTGKDRALIWGAVGIGAAAPSSGGDGIANVAELVFQKKQHHAAIRVVAIHDIERPTNEIGELSALYGRATMLHTYPLVIATGLSAVGFFDCPDDDDSCFTIGLPVVAEISRNWSYAGIGVQGFGNLNSKASYFGGVLLFKLGKLR